MSVHVGTISERIQLRRMVRVLRKRYDKLMSDNEHIARGVPSIFMAVWNDPVIRDFLVIDDRLFNDLVDIELMHVSLKSRLPPIAPCRSLSQIGKQMRIMYMTAMLYKRWNDGALLSKLVNEIKLVYMLVRRFVYAHTLLLAEVSLNDINDEMCSRMKLSQTTAA